MSDNDGRRPSFAQCERCGVIFPNAVGPTEAPGCSGRVFAGRVVETDGRSGMIEWMLVAGDGSRFHSRLFRFRPEVVALAEQAAPMRPLQPVCDPCIAQWLEADSIELISDGVTAQ